LSADRKRGSCDDDRLALPLTPEEALRALLAVDPDAEPVEEDGDEPRPTED
jgi:hypothetical protein